MDSIAKCVKQNIDFFEDYDFSKPDLQASLGLFRFLQKIAQFTYGAVGGFDIYYSGPTQKTQYSVFEIHGVNSRFSLRVLDVPYSTAGLETPANDFVVWITRCFIESADFKFLQKIAVFLSEVQNAFLMYLPLSKNSTMAYCIIEGLSSRIGAAVKGYSCLERTSKTLEMPAKLFLTRFEFALTTANLSPVAEQRLSTSMIYTGLKSIYFFKSASDVAFLLLTDDQAYTLEGYTQRDFFIKFFTAYDKPPTIGLFGEDSFSIRSQCEPCGQKIIKDFSTTEALDCEMLSNFIADWSNP